MSFTRNIDFLDSLNNTLDVYSCVITWIVWLCIYIGRDAKALQEKAAKKAANAAGANYIDKDAKSYQEKVAKKIAQAAAGGGNGGKTNKKWESISLASFVICHLWWLYLGD